MSRTATYRPNRELTLTIPFKETLEEFITTGINNFVKNEKINDNKATPFLKWAGGKRSVIEALKKRLPIKYNNYYESFVGGGALFFELHPKKAFLSDANFDLIVTYTVVKKDPEKLIELLKQHQEKHSVDYYYEVRAKHHTSDAIEMAARMFYLNKTCFNGIWRVNKNGRFNVPIGSYINPAICPEDNIRACSKILQTTTIEYNDFSKVQPKKGDFIYLDPPYDPTNDTSFTSYASGNFTEKDQIALSEYCRHLHREGVFVMLSNSNTNFIRELYSHKMFKIETINAPRVVNCKPKERNSVEEVLITNY